MIEEYEFYDDTLGVNSEEEDRPKQTAKPESLIDFLCGDQKKEKCNCGT